MYLIHEEQFGMSFYGINQIKVVMIYDRHDYLTKSNYFISEIWVGIYNHLFLLTRQARLLESYE